MIMIMRHSLNKNVNDLKTHSQLESAWVQGYEKSHDCRDSIAHKYHILSFKKKFMISLNISLRFTILLHG